MGCRAAECDLRGGAHCELAIFTCSRLLILAALSPAEGVDAYKGEGSGAAYAVGSGVTRSRGGEQRRARAAGLSLQRPAARRRLALQVPLSHYLAHGRLASPKQLVIRGAFRAAALSPGSFSTGRMQFRKGSRFARTAGKGAL